MLPAQNASVSISLLLLTTSCAIALLSMLQPVPAPPPLPRLLAPNRGLWTPQLLHLAPPLTGNQSAVDFLFCSNPFSSQGGTFGRFVQLFKSWSS